MKFLLLICLCIAATLSDDNVPAEECKEDQCLIENNCRCSSSPSPIDDLSLYPQLISLTFDESVTKDIVKNYWDPLLMNYLNKDDKPIGATFFVPHDYTDYTKVNQLYNYGFEIGVNSITKNPLQKYWREASEDLLEQEFGGQKQILQNFANIDINDIIGVRTPQLQLAENYSIKAYINSDLKYDSSWPTIPKLRLFPYTLDYKSTQECTLGSKCPNEAFKGFWILPINDINGNAKECNVLASCEVNGTAQQISDWLINELELIRNNTKVPLTLLVTSAWFESTNNSFEALNDFINRAIHDYDDNYFVSQRQVMEWIQNPVKTADFATDYPIVNAPCNDLSCNLQDVNQKTRYMGSCTYCPDVYPWLGNPDGKRQK